MQKFKKKKKKKEDNKQLGYDTLEQRIKPIQ
jgi:hypothetical protein